jgi:hypothetical protein
VNVGVYGNAAGGGVNYAGYFNGDVTVMGVFANPSDRKLKSNIQPMGSALGMIGRLNPVTYNYIKREGIHLPENMQYGFIAQELETVIPELVTQQKLPGVTLPGVETAGGSTPSSAREGVEYKGINYISLIPILTQGIKEQQKMISDLEKRIADLEAKLLEQGK